MALCCREGDSSYPVRVLATGDAFIQDAPKGPMLAEKEEEGMARSFRSGITHAGWLHKLVGKTPLDVHWKRYWVSANELPQAQGKLNRCTGYIGQRRNRCTNGVSSRATPWPSPRSVDMHADGNPQLRHTVQQAKLRLHAGQRVSARSLDMAPACRGIALACRSIALACRGTRVLPPRCLTPTTPTHS